MEEALAQQLNQVACQLQYLRFDKEKVAQERELLQDSLDARTSVERAEMEKLEAARCTVRDEIQELMQLLKVKEEEEAALSQQLAAAGQRVLEVRQSFAPKLGKLEERCEQAALREAECASKQAAVAAAQEDLRQERARTKQQQAVVSAAIDQAEQTVSATRARAQQTSLQVKELEENAARRRELVQEEESARAAIAQVRWVLGEVRSVKEKTAEQMLVVQQHVSRSRSELASLEAQVPELEEHKRLAVISKNFKEAARLSHEIKMLIAHRDQLTQALQTHNDSLLQLSTTLAQHEEEQQLQTARLVAEEGKAAQLRLKCLRWWCQNLSRFGEQAHARGDKEAAREWGEQKSMCEVELSELISRLPSDVVDADAVTHADAGVEEEDVREIGNGNALSEGTEVGAASDAAPPSGFDFIDGVAGREEQKVGHDARVVGGGGSAGWGDDGLEDRSTAAEDDEEVEMEMRRAMFVAEMKRLQLEQERENLQLVPTREGEERVELERQRASEREEAVSEEDLCQKEELDAAKWRREEEEERKREEEQRLRGEEERATLEEERLQRE